jgi:N-acetylmuramoyl-L-alanine amidase
MTVQEMKKTAIKAGIFALISMSLVIHRSVTKHIMIADASGVAVDRTSDEGSYSLLVNSDVPKGKEGTLIIPLPGSVTLDNIILEDRYVDHGLSIYIDSHESGFYMDNPIVTDLDLIESARCINQNDTGSVCLDFAFDGIYANESALTDNSTIEISFSDPTEKYDKIVVVDAAGGSSDGSLDTASDGNDPALELSLLLKEISDGDSQSRVKLYFTRLSGEAVDYEVKKKFLSDSKADLYVELSEKDVQAGATDGVSAFYNDDFFLQRLSNARFADIMLKSCGGRGVGSAVGVFADTEDEMLLSCKIPAAKLEFGPGDDTSVIADRNSLRKAAERIYSGIMLSLEEME